MLGGPGGGRNHAVRFVGGGTGEGGLYVDPRVSSSECSSISDAGVVRVNIFLMEERVVLRREQEGILEGNKVV